MRYIKERNAGSGGIKSGDRVVCILLQGGRTLEGRIEYMREIDIYGHERWCYQIQTDDTIHIVYFNEVKKLYKQ